MIKVDFSRLNEMLNPWIQKIWNDRSRYIVCKGGGGSGKSFGIIQLCVYRCIAEKGHKYLVVRKVARTIRQSIYQTIKDVIYSMNCESLFKFKESDLTIECINGNKFIFSGLDDIEKLKSIQGITDIIGEEFSEMETKDFRQLDIRLRTKSPYPLQFFILFNPISITHWLKAEFFDVKKNNCTVIETTYKDNKFLVESAIKVLEDFKLTDEYYYQVYCKGNWGSIGKTIFPAKIVQNRYIYLTEQYKNKEPKKGFFIYEKESSFDEFHNPYIRIKDETIKFIEDQNSYITIFKEPLPYTPYVCGVDTAGGNGKNNDFHCAQMLNNTNGEQVAVLHNNEITEDILAEQVYCLGMYYNQSLLSVEVNFSTYPQKHLESLQYPNFYLRQQQDTIGEVLQSKYGFNTNSSTRPALISNLVQFVRENVNLINDIGTLSEMLTFVRNEKGKAEAEKGTDIHDDKIISLGIAHISRAQQKFAVIFEPDKKSIRDKLPSALITQNDLEEEEEEDNIW